MCKYGFYRKNEEPYSSSATNRIITAKDHAFVQINIGHLYENDLYDGRFTTFAPSGFVRAQGDADSSLDRLWQEEEGRDQAVDLARF